jgi:hypothetical protein
VPQQAINVIQILVSAGSGAIAGSLVSLITGPTLAEREERGRRRVTARQAIGRSLKDFRYQLTNARLALIENQTPKVDVLIKSGFDLAAEVYASLPVLPTFERRRLARATKRLLGPEMLEVARLRPTEQVEPDITDAATIAAAMLYRSEPGAQLKSLAASSPFDKVWDTAIRGGEKLGRKYVS